MTAFALANVLGLAAFLWPLLLSAPPAATEGGAHGADAPFLIVLLVPLLLWTAIRETRRTGDARVVALLGTLAAVNAVLRIPKGPSGEGLMFPLPILAGWSLGGTFGFLLGSFSMLVSAIITGGVGPWLPFQMFALGWVGLGAGALRHVLRGRFELVALLLYAWASSIAYGLAVTLWFWPFLGRGGPAFYEPGLPAHAQLVRYWRFYVLTSLPWDTGRALFSNVPIVAVLARPVVRLLDRFRERFVVQTNVRYVSESAPLGAYTVAVRGPDASGLSSIHSES